MARRDNMTQGNFLGADLGGTKLMIGEMDRSGHILRTKRYPSGYLTQREALALIEDSIDDFLADRPGDTPFQAIGVGMIGRIDSKNGVWLQIDHDRAEPVNMAEILREKYGLPCFLDNDVRSAAKAEMLFGYGRDSQNWVYLNVGTGIAAGIVSGGRLITGGNFNAGEVGHTTSGIGFHALCACGRPDCVEPVAAGMGLDRSARILAKEYPDTKLRIPDEGAVPAPDIFALYDSDPLCRTVTDNAAQALANLIMNLVRFCDPDTVVLGGGVMSDDFFYRKVMERLDPYTVRYVTKGIVRTKLDPGMIGVMGAASNGIWGLRPRP